MDLLLLLINALYFLLLVSAVNSNPTDLQVKRILFTKYGTEVSNTLLENVSSAKYEVTENVLDVPDDRTIPGPLTFNYTFKKPLNLAIKPNQNNGSSINTTDDINSKRNKLSILHVNADFDDQQSSDDKNNSSIFKGIKKYFNGLKKDIINGIHGWFRKNAHIED